MDGSTKSFEVNSATTCAELCQQIKEKLGLKNIFGFSIYVSALGQVSVLVNVIQLNSYKAATLGQMDSDRCGRLGKNYRRALIRTLKTGRLIGFGCLIGSRLSQLLSGVPLYTEIKKCIWTA